MTGLTVIETGAEIAISEACLDSDRDIALGEAADLLDADERARAAAFVFGRDRDRFVRAHGRLRQVLGARFSMPPKDVPIAAPRGGKPYVEGAPVDFNMSHSGARLVLAIAEGAEIGVDLEVVDRTPAFAAQLDDLARICMTGDERAALAHVSPHEKVGRFLFYWTAKEARMKLTGEGMKLEPHRISLRLSGGRPVGYRSPRGPRATLRFIPLAAADTVCCLAVGRRDAGPGLSKA